MPNPTDDPGILAALKRLFTPSPDPPPPPSKRVLETPYADTVFALGGRPSKIDEHDLGLGGMGQYSYPDDRMTLTPRIENWDSTRPVFPHDYGDPESASFTTPRHVLMHEEAHRLDPKNKYRSVPSIDPGYRAAFDKYLADHPDRSPRQDTYANARGRGGSEHFAEAMADAVDMLSRTAKDYKDADPVREGWPQVAATGVDVNATGLTPGADTLAIELLKRPTYAHHPLVAATRSKGPLSYPTDVQDPRVNHVLMAQRQKKPTP